MQDDDGSDGTTVIKPQELLTAQGCEPIIRCDGCLVGYGWVSGQEPSPARREQVKKFAAAVKLAASACGNLAPEEQQCLCEGIFQISQEIAHQGYVTKYGVYMTEEQMRGCVIAFWPIQVPDSGKCRVPSRFADLMSKKVERRTVKHNEG
jgi:hypothetical protein